MSMIPELAKSAQIELPSIDQLPTQNQIFREYLQLVFKGLLASQQRRKMTEEVKLPDQTPCSISGPLFYRFTSLPLILSRKLLKVFGLNEVGKLDMSSFVQGFHKLMLGSSSEKLRMAFDLLNLEAKHSDLLKENDVRALAYHIIVASGFTIQAAKSYRSEKQHRNNAKSEAMVKNIEQAIDKLFANGTKSARGCRSIDFKSFVRFSTFIESDIAQLVLTFIYNQTHLLEKVRIYHKSFDQLERQNEAPQTKCTDASFCQLDQIGLVQHLRSFPCIRFAYQSGSDNHVSLTPKQDGASDSLLSLLTFKSESDKTLVNESVFVKRSKSEDLLSFNANPISHSGLVYRFVKSKMIRPFWFELRGSDLYVFKTKRSPKPKMIISLFSGFFLVDKQESELSPKSQHLSDKKLFSFELVFPNGLKKEFLFFDKKEHSQWFNALEEILPPFSISDHYQVTEACDISDVETFFRGFSVITGQSLTITELAKSKPGAYYEEQCRYEEELIERIEVLRACSHPLIPQLKDVHETLDYIYLVQEDEEAEPLVDYFQNEQPSPSEALLIMEQLTDILSFTKRMGVLIGNLTPPSFELCQPSHKSGPLVKLVDLSQARIINPNERTGASLPATLFSAPEIYENRSLGFEADAYSLGVVLSCILFDCLPFQTREEVMEAEPRIALDQNSGIPVVLHSLVKKLLSKEQEKRTTIEGVLKVTSLL